MNKIYKVIWSKVKNQYVVVSELAHSSGKQSRTSKSSIRSRIAALVVCGAIAAFGVLPMNSAFANSSESTTTNTGATIIDNDTYKGWSWEYNENHPTSYSINGQNGITVSQDGSKNIIIGLNPGKGISVSNDTGVSIELSNGEGLKFNSNKLAVDAGDGLSTESGHLAVKLAKTGDNDNSGLTVDTNGLKINNGDTLKINNNQLDVNLADNSLTADTTGLKVNAGDGLTAKDANGNDTALSVKTGAGLKIDESNKAVAVNVGTDSGLTADAESGLAIKLNKGSDTNKNISGLTVTSDGLKVNAGNGLSTETGQLAVKLDGKSLSASENGLKVNAGAGLKIDTNNGDTVAVNVADTSLTADTTGLKVKVKANSGLDTTTDGLAVKLAKTDSGLKFDNDGGLKVDTSSLNSGAVIHEGNNLKDTKASIKYDASNSSSSSIALGKGAFAYVQNGNKADAVLFGSDTYTGGIAIGENSKAFNATVNIGVKDYEGKMGDVNLSGDDKYKTYEAMSAGETTVGSNSYTSGSLSTNVGSYNIITTKYDSSGGLNSLYAIQNTGSVVMGTLNSVESNSSYDITSGVANSVVGMANKTQNSNGSLVFGTGNEITNSIDTIPTPSNFGGSVSETADSFRDAVSDRSKANGGAVLAIGGGNKADYALNSQLIGVQNKIIGKKGAVSQYNMVDGYRNTVKGSNDTVIGVNNDVTGNKNIVLGDNRTVGTGQTDADNNIILGSSDTGILGLGDKTYDHKASDTVVIGHNAKAEADNSVAIGSGSVAGKAYGDKNFDLSLSEYAGHNPVGTVSVGNEYQKRTITNVAAGRINEDSTDAVNGSQLFKTNEQVGSLETTVNKGWTAKVGNTEIKVTPDDNTLKFTGDKNISVTANENTNTINVGLKPVVKLDGTRYDGDGILLNGESGSIHAVNTQAAGIVGPLGGIAGVSTNKFDFDNDGAKFETKVSGTMGDIFGNSGTLTTTKTTKFDEHGATFVNKKEAKGTIIGWPAGKLTDVSFTNIDGGVVTTDKVQGLDNTKWDDGLAKAVDKSKRLQGMAATQGQLRDVDVKVNENTQAIEKNTTDIGTLQGQVDQGWTATDSKGREIQVTPKDGKNTLQFNGDKNIDVTATNGAINVKLNPVVTLDNNHNDNEVVLNGNAGTISAKNSKEFSILGNGSKTTNTFDFDNGGKFETTKSNIIFGVPVNSVTHTAEFNEDGATFTKTEGIILKNSSTTNIDGGTITTDKVQDLDNTTWDKDIAEKVANNKELQGMAATQGQLQTVDSKVNAGWIATDGKTNVNVNPNNNTLKFAGDDNITVTATTDKDGNNAINVKLDDDITLGNGEDAINIDGNNGTLNIGSKFTVDKDGNVSSAGDVTAAGGKYSLSEVSQYAVRYDDNNGVVNTGKITLAGPNGTTIANVADAKNPDEAVNLHQLEAVKETASAGWTAKAGNDTITVKPNQTLNFEGDGNITVSATGGTSNELKFGLNDNITLGDKAGQKTSTSLTLYTDPTLKEVTTIGEGGNPETVKVTGYIPESYIDDQERVDNFISTHGGFMMYATNTSGEGVFGITTDGMVHAKDVISYMPNSDSTSKDKILKYSLNDIGDIVTQLAHATFTSGNNATGMEYTLISDFTGEIDKENPFVAVDENGNPTKRTIGLAVRQDGAVVVGAVVDGKGVMSNETGIRINDADTETGGGKDTITGLSNTDWRPAAIRGSISTFGIENDDDSKAKIEKSKAATQGQLDDLYSSVVGYNVEGGKVNTSHVTLGGTKDYKSYESRDVNGTKTYSGGVKLDNVAYAETNTDSDNYDGSAAVNVDLLKDTIAGVKAETNTDVGDRNYEGVTSKDPITNEDNVTEAIGKLDNRVGDLNYNSVNGTKIDNGDDVTTAIGKLDNRIDSIGGTATSADNDTITGGKIDAEKGTISLTQKDKGTITLEGQFTNSVVDSAELKDGTLTITSKDQYSGDTSSVKVEGLASTEVVGAKNKEDLATAYKDADKDGNATTEYITDSETMVDADVALDHAIQDVASTSYANDMALSNRIDNVEKRLGDVEQRIDKVGAMAAAIANLRTMGFDPEAPTEIAVGVGQYKSETGLAIGVFHYPNQDFMLSASLSTSGDEVMGGIGATWRIGRKTAAEKAKDEEKRILAKAEEIKQAAKRAEVKAQADRHAKLLAEREAKGESIRPIENKVEQTQEQA